MKAVVTGGNGFIGSHLVDKLVDAGWEVAVVDNLSAECNDNFYFNEGAENYEVDICDYESLFPIFEGVDVVFHLAAESRIQPTIINPIRAAQVNMVGTCNVLQAARNQGVDRVIYSSTSSAYGLTNDPPLKETMPKDCLNPYSVTKCGGEDLCSMYTRLFGLKTIIFRYFNVYGDRQPLRGQYAPVVGLFLKQYEQGNEMTIVGDGLQRRDFTHVLDVVEANCAAATVSGDIENIFGEIFNVGSGINYGILDLAKMITGPYKHLSARKGEADITLADNTKIKTMLKWTPKADFEAYIKEEVDRINQKRHHE